MEKTLEVQGYGIPVSFDEHSVHIVNDDALQQLLEMDAAVATGLLVQQILDTFEQHYNRPLDINPDSIAVEIWGHVYFSYLGQLLEKLIALKLIEKIAGIILSACAVIDCGEPGYDQNRWFWDMLAPFKDRIAGWLPEAGKREQQ